jgi:hypothetical protein
MDARGDEPHAGLLVTPERLHRIEDVFHSVMEQDASERLSYLTQCCGGDEGLLEAVQALLAAETSSRNFGDLIASTAMLAGPARLIGLRLGPYEIQSEIGEGGMGTVYLATRVDEAYTKKVAIKLVKPGWTSEFVHQRFRAAAR